MKQYREVVMKCFLSIFLILVCGKETLFVTVASTVSGNIIDVSGNDILDTVVVCEETVSDDGIEQLQVPDNIDFVIDPWQIAGKGQVYSEEFVIKNYGTRTGKLYLENMVCLPGKEGSAVIIEDKDTIAKGTEKKIYIEMQFDSGECFVLSQAEKEYYIEMMPGEEVHFWISGKINDESASQWQDGDVVIRMKYRCGERIN